MRRGAADARLLATGLQFEFEEVLREIEDITVIGADFLTNGERVLKRLSDELEGLRLAAPGTAYSWGISESDPVKTTPSGRYERGRDSKPRVFAEVSSVWDIAPLEGPRPRANTFSIVGRASTRVRYFTENGSDAKAVAGWTMEIGNVDSPGSFLHTQLEVGGELGLSVPRLPGLLATPTLVIEFALSELNQDDWEQNISKGRDEQKHWRALQRHRCLRVFDWQKSALERDGGSPLVLLKREAAPPGLVLK